MGTLKEITRNTKVINILDTSGDVDQQAEAHSEGEEGEKAEKKPPNRRCGAAARASPRQ
jgi:hypothetical protein